MRAARKPDLTPFQCRAAIKRLGERRRHPGGWFRHGAFPDLMPPHSYANAWLVYTLEFLWRWFEAFLLMLETPAEWIFTSCRMWQHKECKNILRGIWEDEWRYVFRGGFWFISRGFIEWKWLGLNWESCVWKLRFIRVSLGGYLWKFQGLFRIKLSIYLFFWIFCLCVIEP